MRKWLVAACWLFCLCLNAQTDASWQQVYEEVMDQSDDDVSDIGEDYLDLLEHLAKTPLDLNTATQEELEALPFLSDQQVMDLIEYRDRYGPLRSLGELRMVRSLDFQQIALLPYFVTVSELPATKHFPTLNTILKHGRHKLTATARMPFYERRGDQNGYLGYRYRHWTNYEFNYGEYIRMGLTGSQDAGEPFMAGANKWGYDAYHCYAQVCKLGRIENLVVGDYKLSMGMGLVANTSFQLGKLATLQSMGRQTRTLRPHASRSEADYFRGGAATIRLTRPLALTVMASHRPVDATLNDDGSIATLLYTGYHRTPKEMEKKHNTHATSAGGSLSFRSGGLHLAANAIYTHLDRTLLPDRAVLYRRYYATGTDFVNASIDYGYTHHHFSLSGETATDGDGHLATINTLSLQATDNLSLVALQRFYSYRYTSLHAHSFSEGGHAQNESGVFVGATWRPLSHLQLQAYADYATFPWARYQVSQPSHSTDLLLQATYDRRQWSVQARYRAHLRQKDDNDKTTLIASDDHRARLTVTFTPSEAWSSKTQADYVFSKYKQSARGFLVGEHLSWQHHRLMLRLTGAYFDTDSYQSRVYMYEPHMQGDFSFPMYYGEGIRTSLMARADLGHRLRLSLRLGYTNYFDRTAIGTGLLSIPHSSMTDLDMQLRWRL